MLEKLLFNVLGSSSNFKIISLKLSSFRLIEKISNSSKNSLFYVTISNEFTYWNFGAKTTKIEIVYRGELTLDKVTKYFDFEPIVISLNSVICPRTIDVEITITDSRINSSEWGLYATITWTLEE